MSGFERTVTKITPLCDLLMVASSVRGRFENIPGLTLALRPTEGLPGKALIRTHPQEKFNPLTHPNILPEPNVT